MKSTKQSRLERRRIRVKAKIYGTNARPRLVVKRSLNHIYAQIIDDDAKKTLASYSDLQEKLKGSKTEKALEVGKKIAEKAKELKISEVVFDRNGYIYHGRVKAIADGAREGGLKF